MSPSRWLAWQPKGKIFSKGPDNELTKLTKLPNKPPELTCVSFVRLGSGEIQKIEDDPATATPAQPPLGTGAQSPALPENPAVHQAEGQDLQAPCGSHHCAGCYEIEPGKWIHPPKSSQEWLEWLARTRPGEKDRRQ